MPSTTSTSVRAVKAISSDTIPLECQWLRQPFTLIGSWPTPIILTFDSVKAPRGPSIPGTSPTCSRTLFGPRPSLSGPSGTFWHHLASAGTLWHPLALSGTIWHSLAPSDTIWYPLAPSGTFWHPLAPSGTLLHHLAPTGTHWHHLAPSGTLWYHMAPSGTLLHYLASSDTIWHHLAPFAVQPSACRKQLCSAEQLDMPLLNAPFLCNTSTSASSVQISAARFAFC